MLSLLHVSDHHTPSMFQEIGAAARHGCEIPIWRGLSVYSGQIRKIYTLHCLVLAEFYLYTFKIQILVAQESKKSGLILRAFELPLHLKFKESKSMDSKK